MMTLSDIAAALKSRPDSHSFVAQTAVMGVSIDSRRVSPGDVFVAVRGETFDGHDYIAQAIQGGAVGVVSSRAVPDISVPLWVVPDTIAALAAIATFHRQQYACPIIALTGSNGKTTVKEMIAAILPKPSYATPGNLNNHIGVPMSVLKLDSTHRAAVFELGANHCLEIAHTVAIVQPQVALVNNIAPAHIEGFGSIEGVANAKGEIYQGLVTDGTAVINADDVYAHFWDPLLLGKKIIRFSIHEEADIYARHLTFNVDGCARFCLCSSQTEVWVELKVPGVHNVSNALAAAACTMALGLQLADIGMALSTFGGVAGRMTYHYCKNKVLVIDDTYNANLSSTLMALEVLARMPGRRIFVFGDMGELGDASLDHHKAVGEAARSHGIDMLLTCGRDSQLTANAFGESAQHYVAQQKLIMDLLPYLDEQTTVLVKGSRASAMENIVHSLIADRA